MIGIFYICFSDFIHKQWNYKTSNKILLMDEKRSKGKMKNSRINFLIYLSIFF